MKKSRNSDEELDGLNVSDIEWLNNNVLVIGVDSDECEGYVMVDRLRYHDYEPDYDTMQFENEMYLNDEDSYHLS